MKAIFYESVSKEVLYHRSMQFEDLDCEDLEHFLLTISTELDSVIKKSESGKYLAVEYEIIFYRGEFEKQDFIGKDIMVGGFRLDMETAKEFSIPKFQMRYGELSEEVKEDFRQRPGSLNLHALIVGTKDTVPIKIEAQDPFN